MAPYQNDCFRIISCKILQKASFEAKKNSLLSVFADVFGILSVGGRGMGDSHWTGTFLVEITSLQSFVSGRI